MSPKIEKGFYTAASLVAAFLSWCVAQAQNMPTASLVEQLRSQYRLAKMGQQENAAKVLEPGTVLVIQKGGIVPVPYASTVVCSSRYQDGKLDSPDALCPETARRNSTPFKVGEKVYPLQVNVDLKQEKISFHIVACDSCNGTNATASSKSEVIFQFAQGYLEKASVLEVEDTIGDVLAIDNSSATQALQAATSQPEEADPNLLTNDKIVRMASNKLGDAVILSSIKTSPNSFDTKPDALIMLKQAGVSEAVLQAMIEAGAASASATAAEPATPDTSALSFSTLSQYLTTRWPDRLQSPPQCVSGLLQRLQNAGYRTITDLDTALNNGSQELAKLEPPQGLYGGVYRPCGLVNATLQVTDPKFRVAREGASALASSLEPAPQPAVEVNCTSYDECVKSGGASLGVSKGTEAFAAFQKASQLEPSKGESWAGMGDAYLQMGHYADAVGMLDKALQLGGTLSFDVMHRKGLSAERGVLRITITEISFLGPSQEKVFSVGPRDISFHGRGSGSAISPASLLGLKIGGKTYRFYPTPIGFTCPKVSCEGPGLEQQTAITTYIDDTMTKLAGGSLAKP